MIVLSAILVGGGLYSVVLGRFSNVRWGYELSSGAARLMGLAQIVAGGLLLVYSQTDNAFLHVISCMILSRHSGAC